MTRSTAVGNPPQVLGEDPTEKNPQEWKTIDGYTSMKKQYIDSLESFVVQDRVSISRLAIFIFFNVGSILRASSTITAEEASLPGNGIAPRDTALRGPCSAIFTPLAIGEFLESWGMRNADLKFFIDIFGDAPFFSAGGWSDKNIWGVLEEGTYDALVLGRWFLSTPDIVETLKKGLPLTTYDCSRFYGPRPHRDVGYTDYPIYEGTKKSGKKLLSST